MPSTTGDCLLDGLRQLGLDDSRISGALLKYINEIERFNGVYSLVKYNSRDELVVKHILDSLLPLAIIRELLPGSGAPQLADVGSGAGLPGIPLAVCLLNGSGAPETAGEKAPPFCEITLVERMGRRAGFLQNTLAALKLPQVKVAECEMERLAPQSFDLVCFRAFRPLDSALLSRLFRLLKPGGALAAYKGRRETLEAELSGLRNNARTNFKYESRIIPLEAPFLDEERHLVVLKPAL